MRRRRGRGFEYRDEQGHRIQDGERLEQIKALAIPPAWESVWICPDPLGHLQATGVDAAGRKQYLYHPRWRERQDRRKFDRMLDFAAALPAVRERVSAHLAAEGLARDRVIACAVRLLDRGFFRIGSEAYAESNGTYGLATMLRRHVTLERPSRITFDYPTKGGRRRVQSMVDPAVFDVVARLKRRRAGERLLAYRDGHVWRELVAADVNDYLKVAGDGDFSAKDFRTWNATVLAAVSLAVLGRNATSRTARRRVASLAVREVARYLGNTPAVCRSSYIDPRVFDRFDGGYTIGEATASLGNPYESGAQHAVERAVRALLEGRLDRRGIERG